MFHNASMIENPRPARQYLVRCAYGAALTFWCVRLLSLIITVNRASSCQIYCQGWSGIGITVLSLPLCKSVFIINFGIPWVESVQFSGCFSLSFSSFTFLLKRSQCKSFDSVAALPFFFRNHGKSEASPIQSLSLWEGIP